MQAHEDFFGTDNLYPIHELADRGFFPFCELGRTAFHEFHRPLDAQVDFAARVVRFYVLALFFKLSLFAERVVFMRMQSNTPLRTTLSSTRT